MTDREARAAADEASRTVAIIGLGLIGGSLARDLIAAGHRVFAGDSDPQIVDRAVHECIGIEALGPELDGVSNADLVVIATPVDSAPGVLDRISSLVAPHAAITDVGSTKSSICSRAEETGVGARFAGSHPLAGDHRAGWAASRRDLFRDATVFLCPTSLTSTNCLEELIAFWTSVGARTMTLNPEEHDRRMAWVSHLPQVVSSALAEVLRGQRIGPGDLGPGGKDMLRLAASDPRIWTAITSDNAAFLDEALGKLIDQLDGFRGSLRRGEKEVISHFFERASGWHAARSEPS